MQIQKNPVIILSVLILFVGLACLQPAIATEAGPTATPAIVKKSTQSPAGAVIVLIPSPSTTAPAGCAVVNAELSLHLRQDPGTEAQVLAYLRNGEVVKLISQANPDWWKIQRGKLIGFARSRYLQATDCR
jgi:uncharacterized protein YgiM (DUF1202 family)